MTRSISRFSGRFVLATVAALAVVAAISPSVGLAHGTGFPSHTQPTPHSITHDAGRMCSFNFSDPTTLNGFTDEYVYWRPLSARFANGSWNFEYGYWKRVKTGTRGMYYGFEADQGNGVYTFSNGPSQFGWFYPGVTVWLGFQIYYSSRYDGHLTEGYNTHTEWLGQVTC